MGAIDSVRQVPGHSHLGPNLAKWIGYAAYHAHVALANFPNTSATPAWWGPLATNAGGVLVFNLTTQQTAFEVRIWHLDELLSPQTASSAAPPVPAAGGLGKSTVAARQQPDGGSPREPEDESPQPQGSDRYEGACGGGNVNGDDDGQCKQHPAAKYSLLLEVVTPSTPGSGAGPRDYSVQLFLCVDVGGHQVAKTPLPCDGMNVVKPAKALAAHPPPDNRTYWLSYDRARMRIKYGRGYFMEETTEMTWSLGPQDAKDAPAGGVGLSEAVLKQLFGLDAKMAMLSVENEPYWKRPPVESVEDGRPTVEFHRLPLTTNPPPKVKDSSSLTLEDLDQPEYTFSADLPAACQILYRNVAGANIALGEELARAISYSIETEGMTLNSILAKKEAKDKGFPYLRVTMGNELGDGPGVPYVLEIWPGGSQSPIHNHGNVCAVIKVLHGSVNVRVFNKITSVVEDGDAAAGTPTAADNGTAGGAASGEQEHVPLFDMDLVKGDVTWMDSNWYQCHQLANTRGKTPGDFCATVQCYKYNDEDKLLWPYFDYIDDAQDILKEFKPDSDITYGKMRQLVLEEYRRRKEESKEPSGEGK